MTTSTHGKKINLDKTRWDKRKEFTLSFPGEDTSDLKIDFPELQDLNPIRIFDTILRKGYTGTLASMTKIYSNQEGEMVGWLLVLRPIVLLGS